MNTENINDMFRFVSCIGTGMEYYRSIKEAMIKVDVDRIKADFELAKPRLNSEQRKGRLKAIEKATAEIHAKHARFEKTLEAMLTLFDGGDDYDRQMMDTMIDSLTSWLNENVKVTMDKSA